MNPTESIINLALQEDIGSGDITSNAIVPKNLMANGFIRAKEPIVVAGTRIALAVFKRVDSKIEIKIKTEDGKKAKRGTLLIELYGPARSILTAERTALNFLQRLSGIATLTRRFVDKVSPRQTTGGQAKRRLPSGRVRHLVKILDTRKTTPGLRLLEKYAVKMGGGTNHRIGLYDMFLIKNNHIYIASSINDAVLLARRSRKKKIEVEVRNFKELAEAMISGADIVMFDNFSPKMIKSGLKLVKKLSKITKKRPKIEISGGISLKTIKKYAKLGVDYISIGALTHSARAADINLNIKPF